MASVDVGTGQIEARTHVIQFVQQEVPIPWVLVRAWCLHRMVPRFREVHKGQYLANPSNLRVLCNIRNFLTKSLELAIQKRIDASKFKLTAETRRVRESISIALPRFLFLGKGQNPKTQNCTTADLQRPCNIVLSTRSPATHLLRD